MNWVIQLTMASVAMLVATAGHVQAGLIYDNGVSLADIDSGRLSDAGPTSGSPEFSADDFVLSLDSTISTIEWSGIYFASNTPQAIDDFTIKIYDFSGTVSGTYPSPLLHSFDIGNSVTRADTGFDLLSTSDIYSYSANIAPTTLSAGRYAVSIYNNTSSDGNDSWFWSFENGVNGIDISYTLRNLRTHATVHDFRLLDNSTAVTPEPTSIALWSLGSLGIGVIARRRKKQIAA